MPGGHRRLTRAPRGRSPTAVEAMRLRRDDRAGPILANAATSVLEAVAEHHAAYGADRLRVTSGISTRRSHSGMGDETAGSLVREARRRAGISQAELGRRGGVAQSVVSAYESGARQPSLPTLEHLVRAAGCELDITIRSPVPEVPATAGRLAERLARHRHQVKEIAERHGLSNVRVFGSVARGEEGPGSDVDLLVDVAAGVGLVGLARCQRDLEALLGARVDLVPAGDLKPGMAAAVVAEARSV